MSNLPIIMGLRGQSSGEPRVQLAIYVADTRKDGRELLRDEFETWVGLIGRALCEMAGGCTRTTAQGLYVRQSDGQLMRETTAVPQGQRGAAQGHRGARPAAVGLGAIRP